MCRWCGPKRTKNPLKHEANLESLPTVAHPGVCRPRPASLCSARQPAVSLFFSAHSEVSCRHVSPVPKSSSRQMSHWPVPIPAYLVQGNWQEAVYACPLGSCDEHAPAQPGLTRSRALPTSLPRSPGRPLVLEGPVPARSLLGAQRPGECGGRHCFCPLTPGLFPAFAFVRKAPVKALPQSPYGQRVVCARCPESLQASSKALPSCVLPVGRVGCALASAARPCQHSRPCWALSLAFLR